MTRLNLIAASVLLLLVALSGYLLGRHPVPSVPVQVAHAETQHALQDAARAETVFVHDTVQFARIRQRYDTVKSVLNVHDTIAVTQFVALADSTIHTCTTALSSCTRTVTAQDSVIAAQRREIAAVLADRPSRLTTLLHLTAAASVGFLAGRTAPRVTLFHFTF